MLDQPPLPGEEPNTVRNLCQRSGVEGELQSVIVDPSLIGGVKVVVGEQVLDLSVRARLESMGSALKN